MDKRIGAQLYTVREFAKTEEELDLTLSRLAKVGYKSIQVSGVGASISAEKIHEICEKYSLAVACTHKGFEDYRDNMDEMIRFHKTIECDIAGLGALPMDFIVESVEVVDKAIDMLNLFAEQLAKEGITFAYHNHAFEFALLENGQSIFDRLVERGKFAFILDMYWVTAAGVDASALVEKLGERVCVLHLKDMKVRFDNTATYAPIGEGNIDFSKILEKSANVRWAMVEQDTCHGEDPVDCLERSYKYLTSHFDFI